MIETISYDEYRKRPGLSSGYIRDLLRSPMHARHKQMLGSTDTAALAFGRYVHAAILEPTTLLTRFVVKPEDLDRRTKAGREEYAALMASGKQIVTQDEIERATAMKASIFAHKAARDFLADVAPDTVEQSAFWRQGVHECKARFDHLSRRDAIVDIKTTTNANKHEFERSISHYGYHVQGCHYLNGAMANGLRVNQFIIIAVESEAPHAVAVYRLDQGYIDAAQEQIEAAFAMYRQCMTTGNWRGYPEEVQDVLCPAWMSVEEVA